MLCNLLINTRLLYLGDVYAYCKGDVDCEEKWPALTEELGEAIYSTLFSVISKMIYNVSSRTSNLLYLSRSTSFLSVDTVWLLQTCTYCTPLGLLTTRAVADIRLEHDKPKQSQQASRQGQAISQIVTAYLAQPTISSGTKHGLGG